MFKAGRSEMQGYKNDFALSFDDSLQPRLGGFRHRKLPGEAALLPQRLVTAKPLSSLCVVDR